MPTWREHRFSRSARPGRVSATCWWSTDCPHGPAEILDGGRYGRLVPVGDDAAMAKAMADVLVSPPDTALLRQRSQEFTVERSADGYLGALFGEA